MHQQTRMKKFEQLRQSINEESKEVVETPKLSRFAKRLQSIDSQYFQPVVETIAQEKLPAPEYLPTRAKKIADGELTYTEVNENDSFFDEEEILARALRLSNTKQAGTEDDMLNQFLQEIRTYNQKQGVRSQDDTKLEILKQVRVEHEQEIKAKKKEPSTDTMHRLNIARQVKEMIRSSSQEDQEILPKEDAQQGSYQANFDQEREHRQKLLEETQQLRLQLHEHEEELDEIGTGIDYTRKLLNLLLALLLITVLIAGAILGYLLVKG